MPEAIVARERRPCLLELTGQKPLPERFALALPIGLPPQSPLHLPNPRELHAAPYKPQLGFNRPSPHEVRGAATG